jgi:beta-galactosidase
VKRILTSLLLASLFCVAGFAQKQQHTFTTGNGQFLLDGKPFRIVSGEVHYPRIPRDQWRQTFRMAKAMGLNTITTYVFWNAHEAKQGQFDFSGDNDVAEFIREAQQEGLFVILRPGPYVCAEWELGGFPAWLMRDRNMPLRTNQAAYMDPVKKWLDRLGKELAPLQVGNGGPILLVQVENEYGSYGDDKAYIAAMRTALLHAGFDKAVLYTADGPKQTLKDALPDMPVGFNFGPGEAPKALDFYKQLRPQGPYIVSEYWDGWFDHWGHKWDNTDAQKQADDVSYILSHDSSISIYMFRGGTSFGWMNGANSSAKEEYQPDVTSYDYDSVLNEAGQPTKKFFLFRDAIAKATGVKPAPVPEAPKLYALPEARFTTGVSLWDSLPAPQHHEHPISMEEAGQAYGYILYRTKLAKDVSGTLDLGVMHQYARVYLDGKLVGTADRRLGQNSVTLPQAKAGARLDILVENTGRINFGPKIIGERIGLLSDVTINDAPLLGWDVYTLSMDAPQKLAFHNEACSGPCFYRATLHIDTPRDSYLDTSALGKGQLWVNGRNLGRFWNIGPQGSLYLPASWLKSGDNDIVIFDLDGEPGRSVRGIDHLIKDAGAQSAAK